MKKLCKNCLHWERVIKESYYQSYYAPNEPDEIYKEYKDCDRDVHSWAITIEEKKLPDLSQKVGTCKHEKFIYDDPVTSNPHETPKQVSDALYYCDGEECSAFFSTGENFGCVHFEPKGKGEDMMKDKSLFETSVGGGTDDGDSELIETLKNIEWSGRLQLGDGEYPPAKCCPECEKLFELGKGTHRPDCKLGKVLAKIKKQGPSKPQEERTKKVEHQGTRLPLTQREMEIRNRHNAFWSQPIAYDPTDVSSAAVCCLQSEEVSFCKTGYVSPDITPGVKTEEGDEEPKGDRKKEHECCGV